MEYRITEELINATLTYLGKMPYVDVFGLIGMLQQVEPITENKDIPGKTKKKAPTA